MEGLRYTGKACTADGRWCGEFSDGIIIVNQMIGYLYNSTVLGGGYYFPYSLKLREAFNLLRQGLTNTETQESIRLLSQTSVNGLNELIRRASNFINLRYGVSLLPWAGAGVTFFLYPEKKHQNPFLVVL
ncbi:MAG: hypothetical protein ABIK90_03480 [candidate division WOR-3 bacterium]